MLEQCPQEVILYAIHSHESQTPRRRAAYLVLEEYLVTALVPSDTACLASSPGRVNDTEVSISRDEMVDSSLYTASLDASSATRSKMSRSWSQSVRVETMMMPTVDERVQDGHSAIGDTGIWVHLLEDYQDASAMTQKIEQMDQAIQFKKKLDRIWTATVHGVPL